MKRLHVHITILYVLCLKCLISCSQGDQIHVWEMVELTFEAETGYNNPYTEVDFWIQLRGPDFDKRVEGFWDGEKIFKARVTATRPGNWSWESYSNKPDPGLNGKKGCFTAISWTEEELLENPNRRGTIRPTVNGRALEYADGNPFLLISDTHWAAATWRYPMGGIPSEGTNQPREGMDFEEFILHLKKNGFNSIGFITCFPNWATDRYPGLLEDDAGIMIRKPWPKPGEPGKAIDMHDEDGNRAFFFPGKSEGKRDAVANFDSINPGYWQNLDKKMDYMFDQGFVPYLESIRRDHFHTWWTYHDFNTSFVRFLKYIRARYGAYNFIFALFHGDTFAGINTEPIDKACDIYYRMYGPMPFGQPTTAMANKSSCLYFGHGEESPWLELHTSGNSTRNHLIYKWIEEQFNLPDPVPVFNNEPYYVGHKNPGGLISGGNPPGDPQRDSYYGRAQAYGSLLSGGLAGHVYGSTSWMGIARGEPDMGTKAIRWWIPFSYPAFSQMKYTGKFILSEGKAYQDLVLAGNDIIPGKSEGAVHTGLDGWAFMMRAKDKNLALLYFENGCEQAVLMNMSPGNEYRAIWFNPRNGDWYEAGNLVSDNMGNLKLPKFPSGRDVSEQDWGLKLVLKN